MNKFTCMLAGASMLVIAGGVSAEPMTLSAAEMDGINAGAVVIPQGAAESIAAAGVFSNLLGITSTKSNVNVLPQGGIVLSSGEGTAVAVSSFSPGLATNGAVAASIANSAATLF
jgi:hypothetical protein